MLQWLENYFLNYLHEWEQSVKQRKGFTPAQRTMMLLNPETLEGLRMTGNYNVILATCIAICTFSFFLLCSQSSCRISKVLLSLPDVKNVLTEKFCQDPLESFFGQQRAQGRRNDNPSAAEFTTNTNSIRVQSPIATDPLHGNCRKDQRIRLKLTNLFCQSSDAIPKSDNINAIVSDV